MEATGMLSDDDKKRIEQEEAYRAQVRKQHGPVRTTSFSDKVAKVEFWVGLIFWGGLALFLLYLFS